MRTHSIARAALAALASVALVSLSACSNSTESAPSADAPAGETSVTIALKTPSWILPISTPGHTQGENSLFISNLYPSLYSYSLGSTAAYGVDEKRSMAYAPEVSEDGKTLKITLKDRNWSDGTPITTKDIQFWWNLVNANKEDWASYRKGSLPDNVVDFQILDEKSFKLTTDKQYSPAWFVDNQMGKISLIPKHKWDTDKAGGGDDDLSATPEGAKKVFAMLTAASKDTSSYATNPLWQTISGPYGVEKYTPNGEVVLKKNDAYSGDDKPTIDRIIYKPFTGDDAEFNVLRSGGIDYGYIPAGSINQKEYIESKGYTVSPWYGWSITYMPFNFNNPKTGVVFKQKYIRQAMQQLIDQPTLSKVVWQDTAAPTCGPVPQKPGAGGSMEGCAYQFDPEAAKRLLADHGWVVENGVATCTNAGEGEGACGAGIEAGTKLAFKVTSQSGFTATSKMFESIKSEFAKAGIELTIQEVPDSVAVTQKCEATDPACDWDLSFFGSQSSWYFPVYASGERLFASDGAVNLGSFSDPKADQLIENTQFSDDPAAMQEYNDYLAEELPVLWMPNPVAQTSAYKSTIKGIDPQDPTLGMYPQDWVIESK